MKVEGGVELYFHTFLTAATDVTGQAGVPVTLILARQPVVPTEEGDVQAPRENLDLLDKTQFSYLYRKQFTNPQSSSQRTF